jgi:Nucleotide modification associated domain 3
MKIIFSRKGFDSSAGNVASPIFPSGEMCSLPIPEPASTVNMQSKRYAEIMFGNWSLGAIVDDLTRGEITGDRMAHLDPDLNFDSIDRQANWRPVFGQSGAAERHLQNYVVKEGDVFVFYGWFRQVEQCARWDTRFLGKPFHTWHPGMTWWKEKPLARWNDAERQSARRGRRLTCRLSHVRESKQRHGFRSSKTSRLFPS